MRTAALLVLLLAACSQVQTQNAQTAEPPSLLCKENEVEVQVASGTERTPEQQAQTKVAILSACIWRRSVDFAPAQDAAPVVAKAVMQECSLDFLATANSVLKAYYPTTTDEASKSTIIDNLHKEWLEEAETNVVKARAGKCKRNGS